MISMSRNIADLHNWQGEDVRGFDTEPWGCCAEKECSGLKGSLCSI